MKKHFLTIILIFLLLLSISGCKHFCSHEYTSQVTTSATCVQEGVLTYLCDKCGDSYTEAIPLAEHQWDSGVTQTDATCTQEGVLLISCQGCDATQTKPIPLIEHVPDEGIIRKDPTCAEAGLKEHHCTVCQQVFTEEIPSLEHTFGEPAVTKEANCTEQGELSVTCESCQYVQFYEYIPTNDKHVFTNTVISAPTCTDPGEGVDRCNLCGHSQSCSYQLKPHSYGQESVIKEPTCTESGQKQAVCQICGHEKNTSTDPTGHTWNKAVCNEPVDCQVCGYTDPDGMDHSYSLFENIPPSEHMAGRRIYQCENCKKGYDEYYDNYATFDAEALRNHGYRYAAGLGFNLAYSRDPRDDPDNKTNIIYNHLQTWGGIPYLKTMMEKAIDELYAEYAPSPAGISAYNIYIEASYGQSGALGIGSFGIRLYLVW